MVFVSVGRRRGGVISLTQSQEVTQMLILHGNGRLTRDPQLRSTGSGKVVTTVSVAADRRDRDAEPLFVDVILWEAQARAAVEHLCKGQSVAFSGRFEPRSYTRSDGQEREVFEVVGAELEYGAKPRARNTGDDVAF
jgi:single stranded DNA-binding protein